MEHSSSSRPGQLPHVAADETPQLQQGAPLPGHPAQNLTPAQTVLQQAQGVLMDVSRSPHDMTKQFAQLKEAYVASTYGVTIE